MKILVLHGPNLNLLGTRQPEIYGKTTLAEINALIRAKAKALGVKVEFMQSNHEGRLIDFLHAQRKKAKGIVINPAAYTHYSYAIRDAIAAVELPAVEVHLSDIKKREPFRRISVIEAVCIEQVSGLGPRSYLVGLEKLVNHLRKGG